MVGTEVVVIPLSRYEQLVGLENRVDVIVQLIKDKNYLSITHALSILGTDKSLNTLELIKREEGEKWKD